MITVIIILVSSIGAAALVGGLILLLDRVVNDSDYWGDDGK